MPVIVSLNCLHWFIEQVNSIQDLALKMNPKNGTQNQWLFIEEDSGQFIGDRVFHGGLVGATVGSQQFTSRSPNFLNYVTDINQLWDWGE